MSLIRLFAVRKTFKGENKETDGILSNMYSRNVLRGTQSNK